jgi:hypothetical protein
MANWVCQFTGGPLDGRQFTINSAGDQVTCLTTVGGSTINTYVYQRVQKSDETAKAVQTPHLYQFLAGRTT